MKYCPKCESFKERSEFARCKSSKDGSQPKCKNCDNKIKRDNYALNPQKENERVKKFYNNNREDILKKKRKFYEDNTELEKERCRKIREVNPDLRRPLDISLTYLNETDVSYINIIRDSDTKSNFAFGLINKNASILDVAI